MITPLDALFLMGLFAWIRPTEPGEGQRFKPATREMFIWILIMCIVVREGLK